jgi:hypothetical protein
LKRNLPIQPHLSSKQNPQLPNQRLNNHSRKKKKNPFQSRKSVKSISEEQAQRFLN